jgi:hypothetical protein
LLLFVGHPMAAWISTNPINPDCMGTAGMAARALKFRRVKAPQAALPPARQCFMSHSRRPRRRHQHHSRQHPLRQHQTGRRLDGAGAGQTISILGIKGSSLVTAQLRPIFRDTGFWQTVKTLLWTGKRRQEDRCLLW